MRNINFNLGRIECSIVRFVVIGWIVGMTARPVKYGKKNIARMRYNYENANS